MIKERYSNLEKVNLDWLNYVINIFIISFIINIVSNSIRHSSMEHLDELGVILSLGGMFYFINSVLLKGLHQNELFLGQSVTSSTGVENLEKRRDLMKRLDKYLDDEKPFLNSELTIDNLAIGMEMSSRELSALINQDMGQSFFDLINTHRVEEAKKILDTTTDQKLTVLEVMYKVGFNSKSSFNTAFKKYTGKTPSQYKKS